MTGILSFNKKYKDIDFDEEYTYFDTLRYLIEEDVEEDEYVGYISSLLKYIDSIESSLYDSQLQCQSNWQLAPYNESAFQIIFKYNYSYCNGDKLDDTSFGCVVILDPSNSRYKTPCLQDKWLKHSFNADPLDLIKFALKESEKVEQARLAKEGITLSFNYPHTPR